MGGGGEGGGGKAAGVPSRRSTILQGKTRQTVKNGRPLPALCQSVGLRVGCRTATLRDVADQRFVECGEHGRVGAAFVCSHVTLGGPPLGFFWDTGKEPCGWCAACEEARAAEGEWNERSEEALGKVRVVCTMCFERMRDVHFPSWRESLG